MGNATSIISETVKPKKGKPKGFPTQISVANAKTILRKYDTILLDGDGVLWDNDQMTSIPGIKETVRKLVALNKRIILVSNSSLQSRETYRKRLLREIDLDIPEENIFCTPYMIAVYLKQIKKVKGTVYVIGRQEMADELEAMGIKSIGVGPDPDPVPIEPKDLFKLRLHDNVSSVVVGFDSHFSYNKLYKATCYLKKPECTLIGTSRTPFVDIQSDLRAPVDGSIVASVSTSSGREPLFVGKPSEYCIQCIEAIHPDIKRHRTLMIGDSLHSDIAFANICGIDSLLALTGMSTMADINNAYNKQQNAFHSVSQNDCLPKYCISSLGSLHSMI